METCGKKIYPNLFSPIRIGNLRFKNRIMAAPTSPAMITPEGHFMPEMTAYLEEKALGGAASVAYGEAIVDSATGQSHTRQILLDSFGVKTSLAITAKAIKNAGAIPNIQLSHGGMYGGISSLGGERPAGKIAYGPSDDIVNGEKVSEMPREVIDHIIAKYREGAKLCKDCGYEMVQVHAAHGWLFSQFLSPVKNRRTDEFGGCRENRARFLMLALDAVREGVGPRFPIEIRISGDDLSDQGMDQEECLEVIKLISAKVDLINVSCGNHEDPGLFCRTHPSSFYPRGCNVHFAAAVKKVVSTPVACIGSLQDPAQMEAIIASGQADLVEIARGLIADPYLPKKALAGQADDITPCLRCYECFGASEKSGLIKCTVNPAMGQQIAEKESVPTPNKQKKILVAGGGPAGMEAAITAAQRGHAVTIVEKTARLGGNLYAAGAAYFKEDIRKFCEVMKSRVFKAKINVIYNTEVTPDFIKKFSPDVLFVAVGSMPIIPPIPGMTSKKVIMATDAELHPEKLGKNVVVVGGGLVGCEAAVSLANGGKKVTVVEMRDCLIPDYNDFYKGGFLPELYKNVTVHMSTTVKAINEEGVVCAGGETKEELVIPADSVVCAAGFQAPYAVVDALCDCADESYIIGDCKNVAQIHQAMSTAYFAAKRV
jgi:2,4-dienoyl-CoA reductase-like NADH-dependent reductase (Old Yellow Enzyme family)/thioredoxin reductase